MSLQVRTLRIDFVTTSYVTSVQFSLSYRNFGCFRIVVHIIIIIIIIAAYGTGTTRGRFERTRCCSPCD